MLADHTTDSLITIPGVLAQSDMSGEMTGVLIVALCLGGVLLYTLIKTVGRVADTRARERTKREVAAYVAEGSITPDAAERLLKAGSDSWADHVAEMVREGTLDTNEAEQLLKAHAATTSETRAGKPGEKVAAT